MGLGLGGVNVGGHAQQPDQQTSWLLGRDAQEISYRHLLLLLNSFVLQHSSAVLFLPAVLPVLTDSTNTRVRCARIFVSQLVTVFQDSRRL